MKIAILAESFLPHMNGVTGSVLRTVKHLRDRGHEPMIVAPDGGPFDLHPDANPHGVDLRDVRVVRLRSIPLPAYREVGVVAASTARIERELRDFGADVVHLASPFVLGWAGVRAADALQLPSVAVYQTDIAGFAGRYGVGATASLASAHVSRLHRRATINLVPSSSARSALQRLGVDRLRLWRRGVDADLFAPERRDESWRREIAGERAVVGFVGRLSPEKQVADLRAVHDIPGVRLVIVGDGPSRAELERLLPRAHFTGFLSGVQLARAVASFDVFAHPGESETFCQAVQEALASGVPVVATGAGGPLDLVTNSVDGWLYRPGDLKDLRERVVDLVGDGAKRAAFGRAARRSVSGRTWRALGDHLIGHYEEARELRRIDDAAIVRPSIRPYSEPRAAVLARPRVWSRYVALGDSITEGLGDTSRMPEGEFLGWAARLAMLLAARSDGDQRVEFANFAVRSRRVRDLPDQVTQALALDPDMVSVLIGSNDLLKPYTSVPSILRELESSVVRLREVGTEVLLGTTFLPRRCLARAVARRFADFNAGVRKIAVEHGCQLLDIDTIPEIRDREMWWEDRVHLNSAGHRLLAYRAAEVLGVPDAAQLSRLEHALHGTAAGSSLGTVPWMRNHMIPWMWRRLNGRTAGDGLRPKHSSCVELTGSTTPQPVLDVVPGES